MAAGVYRATRTLNAASTTREPTNGRDAVSVHSNTLHDQLRAYAVTAREENFYNVLDLPALFTIAAGNRNVRFEIQSGDARIDYWILNGL